MLWTSYSVYFIHSVYQTENCTYVISFLKNVTLIFIQTFTDWFLFNLVWWQRPLSSTLYLLDDFDLHSGSQLYKKLKTGVHFLTIYVSIWMKFSVLPNLLGLLKLMLNLLCPIIFKGEKSEDIFFFKYTFYIVLWKDIYEWICFKPGMVLYTTKLYSKIPVWMILMFTQGYRVTGKLELVRSFCCEVAWSNSNVPDGCGHSVVKLHEATQMFLMVAVILLWSCMKQHKCSWWLIM